MTDRITNVSDHWLTSGRTTVDSKFIEVSPHNLYNKIDSIFGGRS